MSVDLIRCLEQATREHPSAPFLIAPDLDMSNADAWAWLNKLAATLRELGVRPGDVVAVETAETFQLLFILAAMHEGATSCLATPSDLVVDWLFARAPSQLRSQQTVRVDAAFLSRVNDQVLRVPTREWPADQPMRLIFSSGTTGAPKAIAFSPARISSRIRANLSLWMGSGPVLSAMGLGTAVGFMSACACIADGRPVILGSGPVEQAGMISRHGVEALIASPAQIDGIVRTASDGQLATLQRVISIGAPMADVVRRRAESVLGLRIANLYGTSEMGYAAFTESPIDAADAGTLLPGVTMQIVDESDIPVSSGVEGRLRYRAIDGGDGYFRDPATTATYFRDGWFYPGDRATLSADGQLSLAGRESEVINVGGTKLDPSRLDEAALAVAGVQDAACFVLNGGRELRVAVVTAEQFDPRELVDAVAAHGIRPSGVVRLLQIPRTETGKPLRSQLAELAGESDTRQGVYDAPQ